jgi:ATP-binding cassette subfamily F protein 3
MPLVSLSGVSLAYGERMLLDSVNLSVASGTRMALVGPNGSGKTTLMRIMTGALAPDAGTVVREKDTRVSYVPQSGVVHGGASLREEAENAFAHAHRVVGEMQAIEEHLAATSEGSREAEALLWKHHGLQERLDASGFHGRAETISRILGGLGFSREDLERPCSSFSAGWQMRIALARAIMESPDILFLDEPTNYLDLEARTWLEEFLRDFPGGLLLVSHDRYFLDVSVASVAEIYMSQVSVFQGTYTQYEQVRAGQLEAIMARWAHQQDEIARIEVFIRRFRYKASKARQAQSRVNYLERLERIEVPPVVKTIHFSFPPPPHSGRIVLEASGLAKSYSGTKVFDGVGIELSRGEKLVVVGVNGAGKSTLLRILSGRENPDAGAMKWGAGVVPAFYSQENSDSWTSDRQVIEELEAVAPTDLMPRLRTLLGAFLFRGDDIYKSVSVLSGGEKSRLSMLMLLLKPANLLILDEPTNHLDIASKDVLLASLKEFTGTVIFVSHDRAFIEGLATCVLEVKDGAVRLFPGGFEYYLRRRAQEEAGEAGEAAALRERDSFREQTQATATQLERAEEKKLKSTLRSVERKEADLLVELEAMEREKADIEHSMAQPDAYANGDRMRELTRSHEANQARHVKAMALWEELAAQAGELKKRLAGLRS